MLQKRPFTVSLLGLLGVSALAVLVYAGREEPKEIVPHPDAWDDASALAFAKAGVPVPRTVLSGETKAELDLAWIRRAFGYAKALSSKEVQAIERGPRHRMRDLQGRGGG
ncbi:MAG: hypothetical protein JKY65_22950, partial [Planctomycetes bacterium]|nr:hypothetical protein [Planctomycetota bacterium]